MDVLARARIAERVEAETVESLVGLMSAEMAEPLGVATTRLGDGLGVRMAASPGFAFLNRVFAVGLDVPISAEVLDAAVEFLRAGGGTLVVQHQPVLETPEPLRLAARDFTRRRTWAKMLRAPSATARGAHRPAHRGGGPRRGRALRARTGCSGSELGSLSCF